ncbi:MAG: acyltransferase [Lachnospiraceae bacterium]|nr:acyltransferase [Lachnospiraceae bacterium]
MEAAKKRVAWVDLIKGYAMLLVFMVHVDFVPREYMRIINPVFLSAFFFASGYTFSVKRKFGEFFINKVRTILVPFLFFGVINILATQVITLSEQEPLKEQLVNFFLQIRGKGDELWFLACIFVVFIVFYPIVKYIHNVYVFIILITIMSLTDVIYTVNGGGPLPWHLQLIGVSCFFMGLGNLYKRYWEEKMEHFMGNGVFAIISVIVYALFIILNYYVFDDADICFNSYGKNIPFYYIFSFIALVMAVSLAKNSGEYKFIKFVGANTMVYFALHGKIERLLMTVLFKFVDAKNLSHATEMIITYLGSIVIVLLTALILIPVIIFINRYCYFILGKSKQ